MTKLRFYRARDLCGTVKSRKNGERGILPFSPALLWRLVERGDFPKPVHLSEGIVAWDVERVNAWIAERCKNTTP